MQAALLQLAEDFLSAIVFLVVYLATGHLYLAVGLAVATGIGQFVLLKFTGRAIDLMQGSSLALVIVLGGLSIALDDPRFVMLKPSAAHFAIAAVMLRRDWLARYLPPIVIDNVPARVITAAGYAWAALMAALGLINIVIATLFSVAIWAWWISVGALGAKIIALAIQFVGFRILVRRNLRALAQSP